MSRIEAGGSGEKGRARIFLSPPHLGVSEEKFVTDAFKSNYIAPLGPQVDDFEKEFCEYTGFKYAVALASGTAAMHLALHILGVEPGDEVMASTLTFIGSVSPVTFLGAMPVFIDCDRETWNMDPDILESELKRSERRGKMPKAVIPTDLYGQCCNLPAIVDICERFGVPVVCDSAEAMGAWYCDCRRSEAQKRGRAEKDRSEVGGQRSVAGEQKTERRGEKRKLLSRSSSERSGHPSSVGGWYHAGYGAKAAVFSFNGNKIMTTAGGGMLASDDKNFVEKARFLSQQARDNAIHYEHSEVGYNYRMSNILAAIGRGQLQCLNSRVERKRKLFSVYENRLGNLPGIRFMPEALYGRGNRWLTVILISPDAFGADWEAVHSALESENIESRPVWKPMHLQPIFWNLQGDRSSKDGKRRYPCRVVGGTVAEDLFRHGLCLPSGTAMNEADLDFINSIIIDTCGTNVRQRIAGHCE